MVHVTVIEDDAAILEAMSMIFTPPDFKLTTYSNGDLIIKGDYVRPDIFLIDKLLPGIDGLDICEMLKRQEQTKDIPVVILSASPNVANLARLAGADGFVEKPFWLEVLRDAVNKALSKRKIS